MNNSTPDDNIIYDIPAAMAGPKKRHSIQLVWIIPIIAALVGGVLAVRTYLQKGPTITITFKTGDGLEPNKTKVKYREVEVGVVKEIVISSERNHVIATAELKKWVTPYLVEDTRFWVVRPQIAGGSITGLGTLMSGAYINFDIGKSSQSQLSFKGLDTQPAITTDAPGTRFKLHAADLGSLDIGSLLYFRRIQVGQVISYELDKGGTGVTFTVFVNAPYDAYVKSNTRFWNASGIDFTIDANGAKLDTQSLVSILVGGIAFQTLDQEGAAPPTASNTAFTLFNNREEAMKNRDTISQSYVLVFKESVRGLSPGASVDFRGLTIGEVSGIRVEYDEQSKQINMLVDIRLFPERLRLRSSGRIPRVGDSHEMLNAMVASGLRAQLKSGNMLTGQIFIALDYFPNVTKAAMVWSTNPPQFPTTHSSLIELQTALEKILTKMDQLPLGDIIVEVRQAVKSLDTTLKSTDTIIKRVDAEVVPEVKMALEDARKTLGAAKQTLSADAPLQSDLREALRELGKAAQSMRTLTDYLERNPETLIRGKQEEKPR